MAYISGTLAELNTEYAKKQPHLLENLTEETPVLNSIKFEASSHGLWNAYEEVTDIDSASFVKMNSPLPQMHVDTELKKQDLNIMGGELFCPEDTAQMFGSSDAYFAKKTPSLLRQTGMKIEKEIIYKDLLDFAVKSGHAETAGASADCYSMIAFRQISGENTGLYSPEGFKAGAGLDVKKINNGAIYHNKDGVLGYGLRFKGYFGIQLANKDGISAIVNINKSNIPTEAQIDDMLVNCKASAGSTVIFCHPKVLSFLNKYKGNILREQNGDREINRTFMAWNGIRFVTSYNFLNGTETAVTL